MRAGLLVFLASAACALAPGMKMDPPEREGKEPKVEPITAGLLTRLAEQRQRDRALIPDPSAGQPPLAYTVAPYDVLQITVWDHPELTAPTGQFRSPEENGNPVNVDGTVFYPYVGVVKVAGLTLAEIRTLITQRLASVVAKPQLDVRVAAFRGKRVAITGEVVTPSTMPITDVPARVQDAIAFAHGFTQAADPGNVTLSRGGKTYALDLLALYEGGDLSQNWLLQDGDVINVADVNPNRVFVLGEVKTPLAKPMVKRRMTLAEALNDSGWFDLAVADVGQIYVIRGNYTAPDIYRLDASSPDALLLATQFQMKPRDIVYVSTYNISRFNRVMLQILPTVQALYDAAVAADIALRRF